MDHAAAAEVSELMEVPREAAAAEVAAEPEPQAIPDPPETGVGIVHELGSIAAMVTAHEEALDALRKENDILRSEMAEIARQEANHLLDTILEEAQSGEAAEEHQEEMTGRKPKFWEQLLGGR